MAANSLPKSSSDSRPLSLLQTQRTEQKHDDIRPKRAEWELYRHRIMELYANHQLPQVMSKMASEFQFRASKKAFKSHIANWGGNNKNLNAACVNFILRNNTKQLNLTGQKPLFRYRGRDVALSDVALYMKRSRKYSDQAYLAHVMATDTPIPPGLEMITTAPNPAYQRTEPAHKRIEHFFLNTGAFFEASLRPDVDRVWNGHASPFIETSKGIQSTRLEIMTRFEEAQYIMLPHEHAHYTVQRAFQLSRTFFVLIETFKSILASSSLSDGHRLFSCLIKLCRESKTALVKQFATWSAILAAQILGPTHPGTVAFTRFSHLEPIQLVDALRSTWRSIVDQHRERLGPLHEDSIEHNLEYERTHADACSVARVEAALEDCERSVGMRDARTMNTMRHLSSLLVEVGDYEKAAVIAAQLVGLAQRDKQPRLRAIYCSSGYENLALCRKKTGDWYACTSYTWQAVHEAAAVDEIWARRKIARLLIDLRQWQIEWGWTDAADGIKVGVDIAWHKAGFRRCKVKCEDPNCTQEIFMDYTQSSAPP